MADLEPDRIADTARGESGIMCARYVPSTTITLPLTEVQAVSIVVAADAFGVEPWEMAVHILDFKRHWLAAK